MAETFVSPGVYTLERDFSYYASSLGESALGLIGETKKGPAYVPMLISNMSEFRDVFGGLDNTKYVPYVAKNFFKYGNIAYVVRVLGKDYQFASSENVIYLTATGSTLSDEKIFCVLLASPAAAVLSTTLQQGIPLSGGGTFGFTANTIFSGNLSISSESAANHPSVYFPRTYTGITNLTLLGVFPGSTTNLYKTYSAYTGTVSSSPWYVQNYSNASTPMVVSDLIGTSGRNLFTIYTVSDGYMANNDIHVAIENIDTTAKTFDIVVRQYGDTDAAQIVLERFSKLTMDPTGTTYISKMIGDSVNNTGNFNRISKYIYVTVESGDHRGRVPAGFGQSYTPKIKTAFGYPEFVCTTGYSSAVSITKQLLGINYTSLDKSQTMSDYMSQWNKADTTNGTTIKGFHLDSGGSVVVYTVGSNTLTGYTKAQAKFNIPVFGGRDGWPRTATTHDFLGTTPSTNEYNAFVAAIATLANPEEYDLNLLAIPGVAITSSIGTYAREMCELRADTFYVGDMPNTYSSAEGAATVGPTIDSNYASTYWPYVKIYDAENATNITMPATAQVIEAIAYTDKYSYPWFAPAGMNRGLLTDVISAQYKLSGSQRDILYEAKINPIATFPGQGIAIWGQKTLQTRTTALDRINVRRMLLYVRKVIATASKYLVFEQNDEKSWSAFKAMVQPILDLVRIKQGLYDFRVVMDATTNTPDIIDRNQMVGQIYLKPTKSAEVITLTFNILNTGATFEE